MTTIPRAASAPRIEPAAARVIPAVASTPPTDFREQLRRRGLALTAAARPYLRRPAVVLAALSGLTLLVLGGFSPEAGPGPEMNALVQDQQRLRKEVQRLEIELAALNARVGAQEESSPIRKQSYRPSSHQKDDPFFGAKDAEILVEVFSDYQCKLCRKFHREVIPQLRKKYGQSSAVRVVLRDFPLQSSQFGKEAAAFAHCAGEQSKYWDAFELLTSNEKVFETGDFFALGKNLRSADQVKLAQCITSRRYENEIAADGEDAARAGARGAPSTFIGRKDGEDYHGVFVRGAQPFAVLDQEIARLGGGR